MTRCYSTSEDAVTPYDEHDYGAAVAGAVVYETRWVGFDYALQRDNWAVWADDLANAKDTWPTKNFPQGYACSGGELAAKYPSSFTGLEMHARMTPHVQLQIADGSWHDWTPATMSQFGDTTTDCQDSPYTMQWWVYFEDFLSSGTAP